MTDNEKALMEQWKITSETKTVYHFGEYHYNQLLDAVNYAKSISEQDSSDKT